MSLRRRLVLFVVVVVVLPLLAGALLVQRVAAPGAQPGPAELERAAVTARAHVAQQRARAADQAELLALANAAARVTEDDPEDAYAFLVEQVDPAHGRADAVMLVRRDRTPLAAYELSAPAGVRVPSAEEIAGHVTGPPPAGVLLEARALWPRGRFVGWAVALVWLDDDFARALPAPHAALLDGGAVVGTDTALPDDLALPAQGSAGRARVVGGYALAVSDLAEDGRRLLVWAPATSSAPLVLAWLLLLAWAVASVLLLRNVLDRSVVHPVHRAAQVARQVAAGDLEQRLVPAGPAELHELDTALNDMSAELDRRLRELAESRDQLRGALSRLGETLSSSLNLDRTLTVVTDTAMDTVQADRAMLVLTTEDDELEVKIDRGFDLDDTSHLGEHSLPGWVVRTGLSVRMPADQVVISPAVEGGVLATHQLSVPVSGTATGGCIGALVLARPEQGPAFSEDDLRTVRTFARQAGVAIENVLLHQEARRLSLTDPLTELWNFRYFQLQAIREVESATRYNRPLGLLIVDLDHFKRVNDRHGHPVGDQVLAEVARRIRTSTRLPDIVARYGGEEFVLLLPGTDAAGAVVTAERIRRRVSRLPIVAGGQDALRISVTCSVGVAAYPVHGSTVDELLRRADTALYTAKSQGRDRVVNAGDVADDVRPPAGDRVAAR
ncbi:MAG TPA: sensor domain-containing diguanylate cyclase [Euzebyales bacterium]|nr:sensor domain-containing diguanylate cyclase [Euzebyales bacterium]